MMYEEAFKRCAEIEAELQKHDKDERGVHLMRQTVTHYKLFFKLNNQLERYEEWRRENDSQGSG